MATPKIIYEHTTDDEIAGNVIDGMDDAMGDDILSSDYDPTLESWPGVNDIELPEELKPPKQA